MTRGGQIRVDRLRATESFYGPQRAARPSDLRDVAVACPFCPGNEALTGALLSADQGPDWTSRVIANIFPAVVEPDGRHEVIVESRDHDVVWRDVDRATIGRILGIYREREAIGYADGYAFVAIFKNSGAAAGASMAHPHAQVVALRTIPLSIGVRLARLTADCDVCAALADDGAPHIVFATAGIVAYVPDGARTAFEVRIAPRAHAARFSLCADALLTEVATAVEQVHGRLAAALGERVAFNMVVQSAPLDARAQSLMHWEIEIIPRDESFGGFEVGMGSFLVSRAPETAAAILRSAGSSALG